MSDRKKGCAIAAIVVLVIVSIAGYFAVSAATKFIDKTKEFAKEFGGESFTMVARQILTDFHLPSDELQAAMVPIEEFAARIKNGEISPTQFGKVSEQLLESEAFYMAFLRGFDSDFVQPSNLLPDEKQEASQSIARFSQALREGKRKTSMDDSISAIVYENYKDDEGEDAKKRKVSLSDDEVRKCLSLIKSEADKLNVPMEVPVIDLPSEIRQAIERGMKKSSEESKK